MEEDKLDKIVALCESNNKILKGMQRAARAGRFFTIIYWTLIVGSAIGAYYYLQPYLDQAMKLYGDINSGVSKVKSLPSIDTNNLPPELKAILSK